jgi:hypothetical protein
MDCLNPKRVEQLRMKWPQRRDVFIMDDYTGCHSISGLRGVPLAE